MLLTLNSLLSQDYNLKKIIFIAFALSFSLVSAQELIQKINFLELQIKELQKIQNENTVDLDEYIPIIEKAETKTILDKVNMTPELELRMDKMNYSVGEIGGNENTYVYKDINGDGIKTKTNDFRRKHYSKKFEPAVTVKFKLNLSAQLDEKTKFNGRMIFATSTQTNERLCILSSDIKSASSTSAFDVDRAYIDYSPNNNSEYAFTFSFGILPTTGGTPLNYAQNTTRKSLFPSLVFDMNTYGIIATQKLASDSFLRAIAAKAYTLRANFYPYQCNRLNIDNANVFGLYYDTRLSFLGKSLLSFGVNYLGDFKAHPYLGPDVDTNDASVLGDMMTLGLGIDVEDIFNSRITIFAHSAFSKPYANGQKDTYQIAGNNLTGVQEDPNDPNFSMGDYAEGSLLNDSGYSIYIGTRYQINDSFNFGFEYNYGSKYWFSATQGAEDMYNKLATRGHVGEAYTMWNFAKYMHVKLGYMYTKEQYTSSGWHFGEPAEKDAKQQITYLSLKAEF